jgi:hypothetical protein
MTDTMKRDDDRQNPTSTQGTGAQRPEGTTGTTGREENVPGQGGEDDVQRPDDQRRDQGKRDQGDLGGGGDKETR